jgi:isoprenylcysteine carboxyl methyltransferase (ICMT) family protein YpbQ
MHQINWKCVFTLGDYWNNPILIGKETQEVTVIRSDLEEEQLIE